EVLAFGPDGATVVTPAADGLVEFRDATTGQLRGEFRGPLGRPTALALGPDGRLFTGTPDATVLAWDPRAAGRKRRARRRSGWRQAQRFVEGREPSHPRARWNPCGGK